VVWFGEPLDEAMLDSIHEWINEEPVDIVLVIGTSSVVWPAAGFAEAARTKGQTSVVTVNLDAELPHNVAELEKEDFAFAGDAAEVLPRLLEPIIGKAGEDGTFGG
jgi:NAD-dependent SIR2 family protein deacetylase